MNRKKILVDLRFFHPGASGGIENYAYFVLDSIKQLPLDIYIEIPFENYNFYKNRFPFLSDEKILIDPFQKFIAKTISYITFKKKNGILIHRRIKNYPVNFDFVFYPMHLVKAVHDRVKIISAMHAFLPGTYTKEYAIIEKLVRASTALITSWNYPYQEFIKNFPDKKKDWHLIPFVSLHNLDGLSEEVTELKNKKFFLYVSFFSERKNHKRLIDAYSLALTKSPDLPALVLAGGSGPGIKKMLRGKIKELNLEKRIFIYDYLPDAQINFLYKNCYGVIAPTLWEAASGAALEGVYSGKPVLCSNVPPLLDFAEYFKLKMLFFDPLNAKDIAEKIIDFYNNYDKYNSFSEYNARKIRSIDHNFFANEFYNVLKKYSK
jgi:glycosyltransferase involved in cell wall biosynthesis